MFNLTDRNISYILISPEKRENLQLDNKVNCERACSILYSKEYTVIPVRGYHEGRYENSFIALSSDDDNNILRKDALYLVEYFDIDCTIVKYKDESAATKIFFNGSEKPMSMAIYDSDLNNKSYLYNGISFTFVEEKRYFFPRKKEDLKSGMIIEYFNNNRWNSKQILNIENEYEKMFKLLIKYEKIRIPVE